MFQEPNPNYMGPARPRPRLDYADPAVFPGSHYHGIDFDLFVYNYDFTGSIFCQYDNDSYLQILL